MENSNGLVITSVRVFPCDSNETMLAWAKVTFNDSFVVSDLKVISGRNGLFVSMPCKKRPDGDYKDIAHPTNKETRDMIEIAVIDKYEEMERQLDEENY